MQLPRLSMNTSSILGENYPDNETNKRIKLEVVNENNITEAINNLKTKSNYGHDELSNKISKSAKNVHINE